MKLNPRLLSALTCVFVPALPVFICFLHDFSFLQTRVPAAPVSMETVAGPMAGRRRSRPIPASALKATRGSGVIKYYWTCRPPTGTPPPLLLLNWLLPSPPPPQPPLRRRSQPPSPPRQRPPLPPCSHGNPNLGRGCLWCHGRRTGWDGLWVQNHLVSCGFAFKMKVKVNLPCVLGDRGSALCESWAVWADIGNADYVAGGARRDCCKVRAPVARGANSSWWALHVHSYYSLQL